MIGTIKMKSADYYIVDIGSALDATLGALEFDGATKKNKPNIAQGSLIYCRVTECSKYLGVKLSCFNKGFNTKNDLGELKGGMKVEAPRYKHHLVEGKLELIAKYLKFEICFGKNGFIWIKTQSLESMIALYNVVNQILQGAAP